MDIEGSDYKAKIEALLAKEKTARQENNHTESVKIVIELIKTAFAHGSFESFLDLVLTLSKKRGQSKKAMIDMVTLCMSYVDQLPLEPKMKLVETLKLVCDKKIYLEVEYARCCLLMVKHKEDEDNINEAAKILQEVQVETYGSMEKREKIEFILYQMKIMLKKHDFVRLAIIAKKLNVKHLDDKALDDLKITFFNYMILLHNHNSSFKEAFLAFKTIYDVVLDGFKGQLPKQLDFGFDFSEENLLVNVVYNLALCDYSEEKIADMKSLLEKYQKNIESNRSLQFALKMFISSEIIPSDPNIYQIDEKGPFNSKIENSTLHKSLFRKQLVQHNLRVFSLYYSQIQLLRIQELINVGIEEIEDELCELLVKKVLKGKIDRVSGIVKFGEKKSEKRILNDWVSNLNSIFELIDSSCNLIKRENEIYV